MISDEIIDVLLPGPDDDHNIQANFAHHVAIILVDNMKFFKDNFSDIIDRHIKHKYSAEMAEKSVVVCVIMF